MRCSQPSEYGSTLKEPLPRVVSIGVLTPTQLTAVSLFTRLYAETILSSCYPAIRVIPGLQLLYHLCLAGAVATSSASPTPFAAEPPASESATSSATHLPPPAPVLAQSAAELRMAVAEHIASAAEGAALDALEALLRIPSTPGTPSSGKPATRESIRALLRIELPSSSSSAAAGKPSALPPAAVPESAVMLLSLLAHCARAHRTTESPTPTSPSPSASGSVQACCSPASARIRSRLVGSKRLETALLALLKALLPSLTDEASDSVQSEFRLPYSPLPIVAPPPSVSLPFLHVPSVPANP